MSGGSIFKDMCTLLTCSNTRLNAFMSLYMAACMWMTASILIVRFCLQMRIRTDHYNYALTHTMGAPYTRYVMLYFSCLWPTNHG